VSFVCDDVAVLSSGMSCDIVCTSLDSSTAGTRLLNLQQQLPPIDTKAESWCPSITKSVPIMSSFPARAVFDSASSASGSGGAGGVTAAASEEVRQSLCRVKQQLQQVRRSFKGGFALNSSTFSCWTTTPRAPTTSGWSAWSLWWTWGSSSD
jgi:hypothetical protein